MNRRKFLRFQALGLASVGAAYAMQNHKMHDNHGKDKHNSHSMGNSHSTHDTKIDTSFITLERENLPLLKESDFPSGKDLAPLLLLKNESKKSGKFKGKIDILESSLELVRGKKTKCLTYNGSIPGEKIEVFEGDEVELSVTNHLNEPTTIHWHGLPVPPEQDGNPHDPIMPHTSRIYRFTLPLGCAGTYWYHPHPHYITSSQVYRGLAGAFVVKSKDSKPTKLAQMEEQDWFISDLRLDSNAQIPPNALSDWTDGREGHLVLINGCLKPKITLDKQCRIRIYNACSARYLRLSLGEARFILIGTDGGLLESPRFQNELFLSPASRVEVIIESEKSGDFRLESLYYDRDKMLSQDSKEAIFLADIKIGSLERFGDVELRKFPPLAMPSATKEVIMSEDHHKMHGITKKSPQEMRESLASMFLLNGKVFDMNRIDLHSKVGEVEEWIVTNKSHMDHPFHIHGTQFELIDSTIKGKTTKAEFRAYYDTINVRPGESLRLRMKQDFKGMRMYHCHILEHEDLGMMGILEVK